MPWPEEKATGLDPEIYVPAIIGPTLSTCAIPPGPDKTYYHLKRPPGEREGLRFLCESCGAVVEDLEFDCADIVKHFREAMLAFWADEERSTCHCGLRVVPAQPIKRIEFEPEVKIIREAVQ